MSQTLSRMSQTRPTRLSSFELRRMSRSLRLLVLIQFLFGLGLCALAMSQTKNQTTLLRVRTQTIWLMLKMPAVLNSW